MATLEIKKTPEGKWGVYNGDVLIAASKSSCDCDLFAERLAKICEGTTVDHHPELRMPVNPNDAEVAP